MENVRKMNLIGEKHLLTAKLAMGGPGTVA
ncbi:hypothetical protein SAMN05192574_10450 [Mucilaginibacter gossypiicola]|uniref:Uncharacterized protein n=1 Tax=Mucilaginibacter gossypiicola TaxID=551995 RepID=A0A1H8J5H9_9SPHI|nr:hypothetical protein SAMN05192574_10450 [Mucilaginibacter gossypiicola]